MAMNIGLPKGLQFAVGVGSVGAGMMKFLGIVMGAFLVASLQAGPVRAGDMRVAVMASHTTVVAGQEFYLAVDVRIDSGWVYYSPRPGEFAQPATISVRAGDLVVGEIRWPSGQDYETDLGEGEKIINRVYKKRVVIYVPLSVPADASDGERRIEARVGGQICGFDKCINVNVAALGSVVVGAKATANGAWTGEFADGVKAAAPSRVRGMPDVEGLTIWSGLGLALLAGLILNIMPCVLPVIPLRVMGLVQMAAQRRRRFITLGLAFAGGIFLFFAALAALNVVFMLVSRQGLNLSAHFQYQPVRIAFAMVLVAVSGNLFGLFDVIVPGAVAGMGQGGRLADRGGHLSAAGMGLMMAVLATPCSFAILATALAWAQVQTLWLGAVGIMVIGLGMAAPHAALIAFPNLLNKLPKPGRWMELLRQFMGFALLPVAVWLIFAGASDAYPGWVIAYAVVLSMCLWIWGKCVRYDASIGRKFIVRGAAVVLAAVAGFWMLVPSAGGGVAFEKFSSARIAEANRGGRVVLVKFTSATCLSCIWIDRTVYRDDEVVEELSRRSVLTMKADVTDADSPAAKMLSEKFNGAPPLTVLFFPGGEKPIRLDGKFTKADLFKALGN